MLRRKTRIGAACRAHHATQISCPLPKNGHLTNGHDYNARVCAFASTGVGILFLDLLPVISRCPRRTTEYLRGFTDRSIDRLKRKNWA